VNGRTVADSAKLTGLVVSHGLQSLWSRAVRPLRRVAARQVGAPVRLLIAPQDIRTADPTVAADIYAGYFIFDGKTINTHGRSPFGLEPPSAGWAEALSGFGWLRHLRAADTSLARVNARALVSDWIAQLGRVRQGPAWAPRVVVERLLSWLSQSPLILDGADGVFYRQFMRSIGRQAAFLQDALRSGLHGEARLFAAIALAEIGLCAEGFGRLRRQGTRVLIDEIGVQILADGGHVSRNPGILVDLLLDLLPLRQAFVAAGIATPPALLNAVDRMMPMVRTFRHGDGSLALFNGMSLTRHDALATILAHDDVSGAPLVNAPYSGYQRLESGPVVIIVDTGRPPPVAFAHQAHAGTLGFELSIGAQRVIVNCGAPVSGGAAVREAARATAAHSTLVLGASSSSLFASTTRFGRWLDGVLYAGPSHVPVRRSDIAGSTTIDTSHDGYLGRFGFVHRRQLTLIGDDRLEGRDILFEPSDGRARKALRPQAFTLRFHLHYALRVQMIKEGIATVLALPDGDLWLFEAGGLPIGIEESIFFAGSPGPRRIEQLVVRSTTDEGTTVNWSLSRRDSN
jgi:uncharacterized heparinase superfamily protein